MERRIAFYVRTAAVWLQILLLAILNGAFREMVLYARLGHPASQLVSGALLIAAIVLVACLLYAFERGNIWPLVLLATLVAPRLAGHRLCNRATTR